MGQFPSWLLSLFLPSHHLIPPWRNHDSRLYHHLPSLIQHRYHFLGTRWVFWRKENWKRDECLRSENLSPEGAGRGGGRDTRKYSFYTNNPEQEGKLTVRHSSILPGLRERQRWRDREMHRDTRDRQEDTARDKDRERHKERQRQIERDRDK